tara:strand:- start:1095 stop:1238 length:144 start_codon:yes stop_codon:yes gene_type:complete
MCKKCKDSSNSGRIKPVAKYGIDKNGHLFKGKGIYVYGKQTKNGRLK